MINHSERDHALLSASGSSKWLNCTPSARLEDKIPQSSSIYAEEGTLAHEIATLELNFRLGHVTKREYNSELKKLKKSSLYKDEMEINVDIYVEIVLEKYAEALKRNPDAVILVEERVDYSHIVENGFGIADNIIISDGILDVTDLKYGAGVQVDAEENSQLMIYGLGALLKYEFTYDIHTIRLSICQPRKDHYSTWEISVEDLLKWAEEIVREKAKLAYQGLGDQRTGSWCRFCRAKPVCRAYADKNLELAKYEFRNPQTLEDFELADIFLKIPVLQEWAKSVTDYMLEEALKGKQYPGLKVVSGKSNRAFQNVEKAKEWLMKEGVDENIFMKEQKPKFFGITDADKILKKELEDEKYSEFFKLFVYKPEGAPTLVHESDKRPGRGLEQAKIDFKN